LLAVVVGSGIMGDRLSGGTIGLALLANSLATGAGLVALIVAFGPVSGAHFNPLVSLAAASLGRLSLADLAAYIPAQFVGAYLGTVCANAMFAEPVFAWSTHIRAGFPQAFSEVVATFGLLTVVLSVATRRGEMAPFAVGAYVTAAYWFTASTAFANPAVTLARMATNTFTGIRPMDAPAFLVAQALGAAAAVALFRWISRPETAR
jgi:glycerol uptake facilitator-like aquaporin